MEKSTVLTFHIRSIFWVLPDSQVVCLGGFPPQQVPYPLIVDLQVAEGENQRKTWLQPYVFVAAKHLDVPLSPPC